MLIAIAWNLSRIKRISYLFWFHLNALTRVLFFSARNSVVNEIKSNGNFGLGNDETKEKKTSESRNAISIAFFLSSFALPFNFHVTFDTNCSRPRFHLENFPPWFCFRFIATATQKPEWNWNFNNLREMREKKHTQMFASLQIKSNRILRSRRNERRM